METKNMKKPIIAFAAICVFVFAVSAISINILLNTNSKVSLDKLYNKIDVHELTQVKGNVSFEDADIKQSLPDISKYPLQVNSSTEDYIEIFSSTEKAGKGTDGWLVDVAEAFNRSGFSVGGKPVSVRIRGIASGAAADYISSGVYIPDAFSPSNELWGDDLIARGVSLKRVEQRLTGNVAGIVISNKKCEQIEDNYAKDGKITLKSVVEAVAANDLSMGYTNPFASSTGLNFLVSTLYTFDSGDPLGKAASDAFLKFQTNIPYVAYTTLQMKESAKSGMLEGFVFEYQQFMNSPELNAAYTFIPFGVRHDSPVYAVGELSNMKQEILNEFIKYCKTDESQKKASECGFNGLDDYSCDIDGITGSVVSASQQLWKEKKSGNRDIIAVFVADTSGSMVGAPMNNLKKSLLLGSKYINSNNYVGMVTFSDSIQIALPINRFDLNQRSYFTGAVENMDASGATAMYDAIVVATKMLVDARKDNPDAKLMMFVLTDGESNVGNTLGNIRGVIEEYRIPIHTIGYNANIPMLEEISGINEAASINADTDDVIYKIQNLFNAEM